jgi:hypothetical protein
MFFLVHIEQKFGIGIPGTDELIARATAANQRLNIVTPEQEARILKLRAEKGKA